MKRTLRPQIRTLIEVVSGIILIFFGMLQDFNAPAIPALLAMALLLSFNGWVLKNY